MIRVLSFGGGVQTTALLRMALAGDVPKPDLVVFADTQREPARVYDVVEREFAAAKAAGIDTAIVTEGDLGDWKGNNSIHVPLFTAKNDSSEDGQLMRTCTSRFKVDPVQDECKRRGYDKAEGGVEMMIGYSTDEIRRVKPSRVDWAVKTYPLIDNMMRRGDCSNLLRTINVKATKSACGFCPYRSPYGWQMVRKSPSDWAAAVAYDESIRDARPGYKCYVHSDRKPLKQAVPEPQPMLELDGDILVDDECEGGCGL